MDAPIIWINFAQTGFRGKTWFFIFNNFLFNKFSLWSSVFFLLFFLYKLILHNFQLLFSLVSFFNSSVSSLKVEVFLFLVFMCVCYWEIVFVCYFISIQVIFQCYSVSGAFQDCYPRDKSLSGACPLKKMFFLMRNLKNSKHKVMRTWITLFCCVYKNN